MSSPTQSVPENAAPGDEDRDLEGSPAGVHSTVTVEAPVDQVWRHLISARGTEALLGPGVILGNKGESWHSADGPHGVVRSYHALEQIRVSWHPHEDGPLSIVDVQLTPVGDSTRVDLYHEGQGIAEDGRGDKSRWDAALGRFAAALEA
ncbi:SRPBCC domain-containing protein [Terrabacter sp. BE26]|uniref:SRPBCC family protein n=1 Tax=Terrabacter sp. BE26 TaxID=2898152 RepID=UPI0035BE92C7